MTESVPAPLAFDFEWQDPGGARGDELRATWASLSIRLHGRLLTEVLDRSTRAVRSSVFLPLFPLAEWIVQNWWPLIFENERPETAETVDFDRRHNLRWAREGFALPALRFVNLGDRIGVDCEAHTIDGALLEFTKRGQGCLPRSELISSLSALINAVVARLNDHGLPGTQLEEDWNAIQAVDDDERVFCRSAGYLGLDPFAATDEQISTILSATSSLRADLREALFQTGTVAALIDQATQLRAAQESIAGDDRSFDFSASRRAALPDLRANLDPWESGYVYARDLRARWNGGRWKSKRLEDLAAHLSLDRLDHALLREPVVTFLDGVVGLNGKGNPKFLIDKRRDDSRQFAFCRALFEHLTRATEFQTISRLKTDQQQANRAFAAEFLAPHEMLRDDLSGSLVSQDEVEDLADEYGVSPFVIRHQIENHQLAKLVM